jgi:Bacterial protein of unknown function (DUF899)
LRQLSANNSLIRDLQLSFPHLIVRCIGLSAPILSYCHGLARRFGRAFARGGDRVFRTYFINNRGDEAFVGTWSYLDMTALGRQELWEDSPEGYPQTKPYEWWKLARRIRRRHAAPAVGRQGAGRYRCWPRVGEVATAEERRGHVIETAAKHENAKEARKRCHHRPVQRSVGNILSVIEERAKPYLNFIFFSQSE